MERFLRPGGWVLVSVPAGRNRMGAADLRAGHFRRYDREDIEAVLTGAGLVEPVVIDVRLSARVSPGDRPERPRPAPSGHFDAGGANVCQRPLAATSRLCRAGDQNRRRSFRLLQRPFAHTSLGTGLVGCARKPAG